jgi:hypothetical protein
MRFGSSSTAKNHAAGAADCIIATEKKALPELDESWLVPDAAAEPPLRKFAPDEMLTCDACLRANAPTRAQCMYCGAALNAAASSEVEAATADDANEPQFYVVVWVHEGQPIDDSAVGQLAIRFNLKPEELRTALINGGPLPLAATRSADSAAQTISELSGIAVETAVVPATVSKTEFVPVNIRALEFAGESVTAISKIGRQPVATQLSDIQLIVTGRLLVHRVEVDERRSRSAVKSLDRRELSEDQSVLDIYRRGADAPWRIIVNDFDFSCLGERKSLTTFDNAKALIDLLKERTPTAVNDSYARVRPVLNAVWPLENTESQSRSRRPRAGRHDFSTVTASDNESQFNNYSRLVWYVKRDHQQSGGDSGSV